LCFFIAQAPAVHLPVDLYVSSYPLIFALELAKTAVEYELAIVTIANDTAKIIIFMDRLHFNGGILWLLPKIAIQKGQAPALATPRHGRVSDEAEHRQVSRAVPCWPG
jgi:hypothetical protein